MILLDKEEDMIKAKPTVEQWHKFNRLLDDIVKSSYVNELRPINLGEKDDEV